MDFNKEVQIYEEMIPSQKMLYMRRVGAYGMENYQLMNNFKNWVFAQGYMSDEAVILGIAKDDASIVPPEECRYYVCLLTEAESNDSRVLAGDFAGGRYFILEMPHTADGVQYCWNNGFILAQEKGYTIDFTRPPVERYAKKKVDRNLCEFLIPVL